MMQQPRRDPDSKPATTPPWQPRIFDPGDGGSPPGRVSAGDKITLSRHYEDFFVPHYRPKAQTAKEDRSILRRWSRWQPDEQAFPGVEQDPDVRQISRQLLEAYFADAGKSLARNTVAKHQAHLARILNSAGPGGGDRKPGAGLVASPPWTAPVQREYKPPTKVLELAEVAAILEAAQQAQPLSNFGPWKPCVYQVRLHLFVHNTLLRINTVMQLKRAMIVPWRKKLWLQVPAEIMKGGRHNHFLYLNHWAQEALGLLETGDDLFPYENWPGSQSRLQSHRRAIWAAAGFVRPGEGYHDLRRWSDSWCLGENPVIESMITGRHGGHVARDFYAKPELQCQLLDRLPQPAWPGWLPRPGEDDPQRLLF